jgi:hypothetical protein
MGTGVDVEIESAGVTRVKGDLAGIVQARRLARATMRNIRQNLFFRACLHRRRRASRRRRALSPRRDAALADDRRGGDEPVVGLGDLERPAPAVGDLDGWRLRRVSG